MHLNILKNDIDVLSEKIADNEGEVIQLNNEYAAFEK